RTACRPPLRAGEHGVCPGCETGLRSDQRGRHAPQRPSLSCALLRILLSLRIEPDPFCASRTSTCAPTTASATPASRWAATSTSTTPAARTPPLIGRHRTGSTSNCSPCPRLLDPADNPLIQQGSAVQPDGASSAGL